MEHEPAMAPGLDSAPARVNWPKDWRTTQERIPGRDCMPPHALPPMALCNDELCQEWLERTSIAGPCENDHAHDPHYWSGYGDPYLSTFRKCGGRLYCNSKYMEPGSHG